MHSSSALVGIGEATRRRRLVVCLVTSGAAALLAACGTWTDPVPTPEASPTISPSASEGTPTPSATPTPTPTTTPTWSADLTACGSTVDAPETEGLWVGNYGGGIGVPAAAPLAAPLELPLSVILTQDLGGQQITVAPLQAYLVGAVQGTAVGTSGTVVAVVGAPLPAAVSTSLGSGSEGGGGGSEGHVVLPVTFTGCSQPLAPGWYGVLIEVEVSGAAPTVTTWAHVPVLVEA